ncbi:GGDEF domain-containing protein [Thalassotalea sp. HSM 43]|uniref:GGDEF domain-containing protein n=1 Tax=Thalassotalea sp. HSM 43 TaxID=2552945 RepID=UPI001E2CB67F|nr:GGDEF domain-containing protein [Thalassotalea sp. HSM 43]
MTDFLQTSKAFILGVAFIILAHIGLDYSAARWSIPVDSVQYSLPVLFAISLLLPAYFKQARISFLTIIVSAYYYLPEAELVISEPQLYLYGLASLAWLSMITERGVFSGHAIKQVLLLIATLAAAYLWLFASAKLQLIWPQLSGDVSSVYLPSLIVGCVVLWRNMAQPSLSQTAVLATYLIWCIAQFELVVINWPITMAILCCYYLLVVIVNSYFLAYRDELTGLPSRRALNQYASTLGNTYVVAMLDIDHFKKFNDTYGHDVGDQVLKLVATKIAKVRRSGKAFRYGGEEFSLIFPRKNSEQVMAELERMRKLIAHYKMAIRQLNRQGKQDRKGSKVTTKTVHVTVSIGVAVHQKQMSFDDTIKIADQALYKAKKAGRNRVVSA